MRDALIGLVLLAAAGYFGRDPWAPERPPSSWPAYAAPQVACGSALPKTHEGRSVRFRYPDGWKIAEKRDASRGLDQTFLAPPDGRGDEVILLFREGAASAAAWPAAGGPSAPAPLRQAPASAPSGALTVGGTQQSFLSPDGGPAYAYLTRSMDPAWDSWMVFLWDRRGAMTAASGPRLAPQWWPPRQERNRRLNCAFWDVLRTVEAR